MTEEYKKQTGNENTTVYYNGSNCVVEILNYEVIEEIEYIYINVTSNETTTEVVELSAEEVFQRKLDKGVAKEQWGFYAVTAAILIGILLYFMVDCLFAAYKKKSRFSAKVKASTPSGVTPNLHEMSIDEKQLNEEIRAINQDIEVESEEEKPRKRMKGFLQIHKEL